MTTIRELWNDEWVERPTLTAGEARAILARAKERGWLDGTPARLNKGLTRKQAWEILSAGIKDRADDYAIDSLIAKNIQREFGT